MKIDRKGWLKGWWIPQVGLGFCMGLALISSCGTGNRETPKAENGIPAEPSLSELLARQAVYQSNFACLTIYTWTTSDQIAELRKSGVLLQRTESPERGRSGFDQTLDQALEHPAFAGTEMVKLLRNPPYNRRRFGWSNPWATLLGWSSEKYGDQLVEVRLREEAILGRFLPAADPPWSFVDGKGNPVPVATVLQKSNRLAAIYYANKPSRGLAGTYNAGSWAYREYVLVNEGMVAAWSYGTQELRKRLEDDIQMLRRFSLTLDTKTPAPLGDDFEWNSKVSQSIWRDRPASATIQNLYEAGLAIPNENYRPSTGRLHELIQDLEKSLSQQGEPLIHNVDSKGKQ